MYPLKPQDSRYLQMLIFLSRADFGSFWYFAWSNWHGSQDSPSPKNKILFLGLRLWSRRSLGRSGKGAEYVRRSCCITLDGVGFLDVSGWVFGPQEQGASACSSSSVGLEAGMAAENHVQSSKDSSLSVCSLERGAIDDIQCFLKKTTGLVVVISIPPNERRHGSTKPGDHGFSVGRTSMATFYVAWLCSGPLKIFLFSLFVIELRQ